jgi:hypothetical protein
MNLLYMNVVATAPETALVRFRRLRRDTNLAFLDWLREQPDPRDVADEITASIHVLRLLAAAAAGDLA